MIVDSNILIYSSRPEHVSLRNLLAHPEHATSDISRLEVLGYKSLQPHEKRYFEEFFSLFRTVAITPDIIDIAIGLRQQKSMSLGDSIVAATAIQCAMPVMTRNAKDFSWISGLTVFDPLAE